MSFDDDFDLPLPSKPVPTPNMSISGVPHPVEHVTDATPYKTWTCVYPIYIDAKRPYGTGRRRVAREKSCWWPHSQLIATAAVNLRLRTFHEPNKTHPRDWENPGRVKILFEDNGRFLNPHITTKKQLLEAIAITIQHLDGSQKPRPEQIKPVEIVPDSTVTAKSTSLGSTKAPGSNSKASDVAKPRKAQRTRTPQPPQPIPPLSKRYMVYSPLVESGILVDTVKVGLKQAEKSALEAAPGTASGSGAGGQGIGKGKRKVLRVRG